VNLDFHTSVIDVDVVHQASNESNYFSPGISRFNKLGEKSAKHNSTKPRPTRLRGVSHWNQEQNMGQYQSRELLWYYQWCLGWYCPFQGKYFQCIIGKSRKSLYRRANFLDKAVSFEFFSQVNGLSKKLPINRASLWNPSSTEETVTSLCIFLSPLF